MMLPLNIPPFLITCHLLSPVMEFHAYLFMLSPCLALFPCKTSPRTCASTIVPSFPPYSGTFVFPRPFCPTTLQFCTYFIVLLSLNPEGLALSSFECMTESVLKS